MSVKRYFEQPLPIVVAFPGNPFLVYNKDYSDVTEYRMNLKRKLATDLDDDYLQRSSLVPGDVVVDEVNHKFTMKMEGGYVKLEKGVDYFITVNAKVTGFTNFIELKINEAGRKVSITDDTNRD